ncbi:flavin reductase family protein [Pseudoalteromonas piscicida]|uniref:Flavin oxidoreductase n=1 Tax=Pseudoalteromonas piscicida TaxID=43662 RepID=A0A2A5JTT5_PSEO7|nr:flavin reductase [Pseudoalteromonas piscicida]PCK32759.1 flavin oxidoreductase [Pseudoalteromonas piscicida]
MKHFSNEDIKALETRFRALMINSLSGFKSANLIGTVDANGQENLSIVSSVFHLGACPPLVGVIFRPHSVPRHTLENILETKKYTINQVNIQMYMAAHQTSARYDKSESEFEQTGLTAEYNHDFPAPFVKESRLKYGLTLKDHQLIKLNDTELVIGEIESLHVDDIALLEDGYIDIEALDSVAISSLDGYHKTQRLNRLEYAKPHNPTRIKPLG